MLEIFLIYRDGNMMEKGYFQLEVCIVRLLAMLICQELEKNMLFGNKFGVLMLMGKLGILCGCCNWLSASEK